MCNRLMKLNDPSLPSAAPHDRARSLDHPPVKLRQLAIGMPLGFAILSLSSVPSLAQTVPTGLNSGGSAETTSPGNAAAISPTGTATPTAEPTVTLSPAAPTPTNNPTPLGQPQPVPIYIPVPMPGFPAAQSTYPTAPYGPGNGVYPLAQPTYTTAPTVNSGGMTVQVTTQIGLPGGMVYPAGVAAPGVPGAPPGNWAAVQYPAGYGGGGWPGVNPGYPNLPASGASGLYGNPALVDRTEAIANPALLPAMAQTLWQQVVTNTATRLDPSTLTLLRQLVQAYPQFIPGHLRLAQALAAEDRTTEAIAGLEQATALYPQQPELARSLIAALSSNNRTTEAILVARQFALKSPNSALASEFTNLAAQRSQIQPTPSVPTVTARRTLLNNVLTAGMGYLLTGRNSGVSSGTSLGSLLAGLGGTATTAVQSNLERELMGQVNLLNDLEVTNYVRDLGRKLVLASDNPTQPYEFYVVNDREVGATAMPGGKIFVSAGAIANANSEAALANVLAKQLGHAILAHPTRLERRSNLTNTITGLLPTVGGILTPKLNKNNSIFGNVAGTVVSGVAGNVLSNLLKPKYTSSMTRDADALAQKLMQAAGYSQANTVNVSTNTRYSVIQTKVQQLMGTASSRWWNR